MFTAIIYGILSILTLLTPTIITATIESEIVPPHISIGTATIDGIMDTDEWINAARTPFSLIENSSGNAIPATLYTMNDESNFFAALVLERRAANFSEIATLYLDHNGNGLLDDGDDALRLSRTFSASSAQFVTRFADSYGSFCSNNGCEADLPDVEDAGTNDGAGAVVNDGNTVVFEWVHPLNSPDTAHDATLSVGKMVQLQGKISILSSPVQEAVSGLLPKVNVYIAQADAEIMTIDADSRHSPNEWSMTSTPWALVSILSNDSFDATGINQKSLTFGKTGDEKSVRRVLRVDINGDGLKDLLVLVKVNKTGLAQGDELAIMRGVNRDGTAVIGIDSVLVSP
jgi:hypothetical protein